MQFLVGLNLIFDSLQFYKWHTDLEAAMKTEVNTLRSILFMVSGVDVLQFHVQCGESVRNH